MPQSDLGNQKRRKRYLLNMWVAQVPVTQVEEQLFNTRESIIYPIFVLANNDTYLNVSYAAVVSFAFMLLFLASPQ
ncbi:hypothetical protein TNCT_115741 [Trichonephila clavata]|uniref:Uncharacterized protein n=1 Tax=Trichonephila clavata TaxID=2740835 RepID=A0A8X6FIU2_TRICU|nr:hypothetical protein TNCT_115741 [Trichonephila clavata]